MTRRFVILSLLLPGALVTPVFAQELSAPVDSFVHLEKNTNSNEVHYKVHVDELCRPQKKKPVEAYWREFEEGPEATEGLKFWEQPGYGVRQPEKVSWDESGGQFEFSIRGVPSRMIRLVTFNQDDQCRARAFITINDSLALFDHIEIVVSGWATVHKVEIFGSLPDGRKVSEVTHSRAE